jgi:uncharacterized membrane protein
MQTICQHLAPARVLWAVHGMFRAAESVCRVRALPRANYRLFWTWFAFGLPAFAAVLAILWLMTSRPIFSFR